MSSHHCAGAPHVAWSDPDDALTRRRIRRQLMLLVVATCMAYSNSLTIPFLFDDEYAIVQNATIRNLSSIGDVMHPPGGGVTVQARPLTNLSLAFNFAIGQLNVTSYHVFNLGVHIFAGLTLYGLVRRLMSGMRNGGSARAESTSRRLPAGVRETSFPFAVALFWLLHPLCTQAVVYIVQRAELLAGLAYFATLYGLVRAATSNRGTAWACVSVAACALGTACKETIVTAPVAALLLDRAYLSDTWRGALQKRKWLHSGLFATWGLLLLIQTSLGGWRHDATGFQSPIPPWQYLATEAGVALHYFGLALFPRQLCFDYEWPLVDSLRGAWPACLLAAALLASAFILWHRSPRWGFPALWPFLTLLPTSSVMPIADAAAEHRMYVPLAGLIALIVAFGQYAGIRMLPQRVPSGTANGCRWRAWLPTTMLALLAMSLGTRTWIRNLDYHSALTLWTDTIEKRPTNARAHYVRAMIYAANGRHELAIVDYTHAANLRPDRAYIFYNRGNSFAALARDAEAEADYTRALALEPTSADAHHNRAAARYMQGDLTGAWEDVEACQRLGSPPSPELVRLLKVASAAAAAPPPHE